MKLSICIPTYNRPSQLPNCLNSICIAKENSNLDFDVCISDNGSNYDVRKIIDSYKDKLSIVLTVNKNNLGYQPTLIKKILKMRIDMLGFSFIPQHSDARVSDQLIYKWSHFKKILPQSYWNIIKTYLIKIFLFQKLFFKEI